MEITLVYIYVAILRCSVVSLPEATSFLDSSIRTTIIINYEIYEKSNKQIIFFHKKCRKLKILMNFT